jgi:hypothetical protein
MLLSEMTICARVRLVAQLIIYPLGTFPKGATGMVVEIGNGNPSNGDPVCYVLMDSHFSVLDEWNNMLQVFHPEFGECTAESFIPGITPSEAYEAYRQTNPPECSGLLPWDELPEWIRRYWERNPKMTNWPTKES